MEFTKRWLEIGASDIESTPIMTAAPRPLKSTGIFPWSLDAMPDTRLHIAHFHETKRRWPALRCWRRCRRGITHFEATLGGLGGQPANFLDDCPVPGTGDYYYKGPTLRGACMS